MSDEAKLMAQANRGERAKRILDDPLFIEGFEKLEEELIRQFRFSDVGDSDGHRHVRESLKLLNNLRDEFKRVLITGDNARKEITRIREKSRIRRALNV